MFWYKKDNNGLTANSGPISPIQLYNMMYGEGFEEELATALEPYAKSEDVPTDDSKQIFLDKCSELYDEIRNKIIKQKELEKEYEMKDAQELCDHRWPNGMVALTGKYNEGYRKCFICHKMFKFIEPKNKQDVINIIETAKVIGLSDEEVNKFCDIIFPDKKK